MKGERKSTQTTICIPGRGALLSRNLISVDWNGNGKFRMGLSTCISSSSQLSSSAFLSISFLQSSP